MKNFTYKNPTKIIFGKGQIAALNDELSPNDRILMLYGGGSIKRNGIYEQVKTALGERCVVEFGGIPANPEYEVLLEAVSRIKENNLNYILAVGGGSVIDGAKFISAAVKHSGSDAWNILSEKLKITDALPFATVLTLPATGSEMNAGAVISRRKTNEKLSFGSPLLFPQFSVLDPSVVESLPQRQIENGIVDAFTHVLEQYMTSNTVAVLQDHFAESILQTLIEISPRIHKNPSDYEAAANFMWACTMALNGLISQGVPTDWGVHAIGHELTALFGIDHARTLAIVAPRYYEYCFEEKKQKLAQYAQRIWQINEGNTEEKARKAIEKTEEFFHSLSIKTSLSDYTDDYEGTAEKISQRFTSREWFGIGEMRNITPEDVKKIVQQTYKGSY